MSRRDTILDFVNYSNGARNVEVRLVRVDHVHHDRAPHQVDFEVRTPTQTFRFGNLKYATYYMREIQRGYARPE